MNRSSQKLEGPRNNQIVFGLPCQSGACRIKAHFFVPFFLREKERKRQRQRESVCERRFDKSYIRVEKREKVKDK